MKLDIKKLIREEVKKVLNEALKFPPGKFDEQYKQLIKAAQKQPKWDSKPDVNRTTATHGIDGQIGGKDFGMLWQAPGHFGPTYVFKGIYGPGNTSKLKFDKSGDKINDFEMAEQARIAQEKKLSTRMPIVWLLAAKNIPDELIKANLKEFADAIKSIS